MDTNRSCFTERDLREVQKELDPDLPPKIARKENRELRKSIARRTRRLEKREFEKLVDLDLLEEAMDFDRR